MKTVEMVPPPLPPSLLDERDRDHLMETFLLLRVPEVRATYLTLGDLLSLEDDNGNSGIFH